MWLLMMVGTQIKIVSDKNCIDEVADHDIEEDGP